ncbi:hypothetical protein E4U49_005887 [Claviceps purpurea]|nr:hypothetical protein E4U49_005887 [Claviceps purpurea]
MGYSWVSFSKGYTHEYFQDCRFEKWPNRLPFATVVLFQKNLHKTPTTPPHHRTTGDSTGTDNLERSIIIITILSIIIIISVKAWEFTTE